MSKKLFPILATTGVIFISNSSFAENSEKVSPSENTVQQLETMTFTASRADEVQEKSKQVTKLDEKQIELLKNGSSGNIATVLAKAVPGLSDSSRTITDYGQTLRGRNALILVDGVPMNLTRDTSRGLSSIDPLYTLLSLLCSFLLYQHNSPCTRILCFCMQISCSRISGISLGCFCL